MEDLDGDLRRLAARYHYAEGGRPGLAPSGWALVRLAAPALFMVGLALAAAGALYWALA